MSAFTDEDLKRLKESLKRNEYADNKWIDTLVALLLRLEAAERYAWAFDPVAGGPPDKDFCIKAREAWRKASGQ